MHVRTETLQLCPVRLGKHKKNAGANKIKYVRVPAGLPELGQQPKATKQMAQFSPFVAAIIVITLAVSRCLFF